jgi:tetratricopeptide (TPR) repeat protein
MPLMTEHNTVFISYRRTNMYMARAVYQDLRANGYDVFLDNQSIDSGDFTQVILNQIAARAHFVLILTPSALERCVNSDDMLRLEIEHAIELKRNFVPLMFEGFNYEAAEPYLVSDKLKLLTKYNGMNVHDDYFEEAMVRLRTRFLSRPLEGVVHPVPHSDQAIVQESIILTENTPKPTQEQRKAEEYFEKGFTAYWNSDYRTAVENYTLALSLNPLFGEAYYRRGDAYFNLRKEKLAVQDWQEAVSLSPDDRRVNIYKSSIHWTENRPKEALAEAEEGVRRNPEYDDAYFMRANARAEIGDLDGAIEDFSEAIRLRPNNLDAYNNRGNTWIKKGDLDEALADYNRAISLSPNNASFYYNRAIVRTRKQDFDGAINDYSKAIELNPHLPNAFNNRGTERFNKGDYDGAVADYRAAINIDPTNSLAKRNLERARQRQNRK